MHGPQLHCSRRDLTSLQTQITPFRFVGSTVMMNRLRTASSPYLGGDDNSSVTSQMSTPPQQTDTIAAVGGGKLWGKPAPPPLLPLDQKTPLVSTLPLFPAASAHLAAADDQFDTATKCST